MHVVVNGDGTWSYEEVGVLEIPGNDEPFSHIDRNTLSKIGPPTPNPLSTRVTGATSLEIGGLREKGRS